MFILIISLNRLLFIPSVFCHKSSQFSLHFQMFSFLIYILINLSFPPSFPINKEGFMSTEGGVAIYPSFSILRPRFNRFRLWSFRIELCFTLIFFVVLSLLSDWQNVRIIFDIIVYQQHNNCPFHNLDFDRVIIWYGLTSSRSYRQS